MRKSVCFFGEALFDFYCNNRSVDPHIPLAYSANIGGGILNAAVAAKRWLTSQGERSYPVQFIGGISRDTFGQRITALLQKEQIDESKSYVTQSETAIAFVSNEPNGERSFQFRRTATADIMVPASHLQRAWFDAIGIFACGTNCMTDETTAHTTHHAVQYARAAHIPFAFDPNIRPLLWHNKSHMIQEIRSLIPFATILKLSVEELQLLFVGNGEEMRIKNLFSLSDTNHQQQILFLSRGADGCSIYFQDGRSHHIPAIHVDVVDTTGAGDALFGTLCAALALNPLKCWGAGGSSDHFDAVDINAIYAAAYAAVDVAAQCVQVQGALGYSL